MSPKPSNILPLYAPSALPPLYHPMAEVQTPCHGSEDLEKGTIESPSDKAEDVEKATQTDVPSNEVTSAAASAQETRLNKSSPSSTPKPPETTSIIAGLLIFIQVSAWATTILVHGPDPDFYRNTPLGSLLVMLVPATLTVLFTLHTRNVFRDSPYLDVALTLCPLWSAMFCVIFEH